MKILLLGFEYLDPEFLVNDDHLESFNRLMQIGCYGVISIPDSSFVGNKWVCLLTGRHSTTDDPQWIKEQTRATSNEVVITGADVQAMIWDSVIAPEMKAFIFGNLPFSIDKRAGMTHEEIDEDNILHEAKGIVTFDDRSSHLLSTCSKKFERIKAIVQSGKWDFIYSLDSGLAQLQSTEQVMIDIHQKAILSYYCTLDHHLGELVDLLSDDTILMLVSLRSEQPQDLINVVMESTQDQPDFFMLAAANFLMRGELEGVQITDLSPSLLELGGYDIPPTMDGKSFVSEKMINNASSSDLSEEELALLRERLSGLGYF
jgi:hypothetical protein